MNVVESTCVVCDYYYYYIYWGKRGMYRVQDKYDLKHLSYSYDIKYHNIIRDSTLNNWLRWNQLYITDQ